MSKLRDIRLLAARKRNGAKPSKRVIPKELAIFAGRANKGIYKKRSRECNLWTTGEPSVVALPVSAW